MQNSDVSNCADSGGQPGSTVARRVARVRPEDVLPPGTRVIGGYEVADPAATLFASGRQFGKTAAMKRCLEDWQRRNPGRTVAVFSARPW